MTEEIDEGQILSIYNEYYNKESNSKYFIKYNFTKNKYIKYTTNFEEIDENIDNKLYNDTVLHKSLTNSYYIDNNVINNSYTNNFNIQNINLLDYVDKEDLENNEFTIRFKFELTENKEKNEANNITVLKPLFNMFTNYSKMNISIEDADNTYDYKITYNDIEEFNNSYNLYANKEIEFNIKRTKHTTEEPTIIKKRSTSTTTELSTTTTELYTTTEKPKDKLNMNISFNLYSKYKMTGYFNIKPIIQVKKKITDKLKYSSDNKANNNYNFYLNGNNYIFDDNTSEYNISLYKQFFEKQTKIKDLRSIPQAF
jgi:hypothetical protein